jgi:DNA-binding PadR family transcriptional regulator
VKILERRRRQAQLIVLGAIFGQGEQTTYQLLQCTELSPGRLVAALEALQSAGRISSRWQDGPDPRRRLYRYVFTKGGVTALPREG